MPITGKTALVLCGGGSRGSLQIGLYRALTELGINIDLIVATSVGAINGAFIAAGASPKELGYLWESVSPHDLYQINRQLLFRPFRAESLLDNRRLGNFLMRHLPVLHFEDLRIPLLIGATHLQTGEPVWFREGELITPLLAAIAMPGLFPPVDIGGRQLIDGGISNNVPLDMALKLGAQTVICMLCICCERIPYPVHGWVNNLIYSFSIAVDRKYRADAHHYQNKARLIVIEPHNGMDVGMLDFSHTGELIELGYRHAMETLTGLGEKNKCDTKQTLSSDPSTSTTQGSG